MVTNFIFQEFLYRKSIKVGTLDGLCYTESYSHECTSFPLAVSQTPFRLLDLINPHTRVFVLTYFVLRSPGASFPRNCIGFNKLSKLCSSDK